MIYIINIYFFNSLINNLGVFISETQREISLKLMTHPVLVAEFHHQMHGYRYRIIVLPNPQIEYNNANVSCTVKYYLNRSFTFYYIYRLILNYQ